MPTLLPEQLRAQVNRWRQRRGWESERVFAIRTDFPYAGGPDLNCDGLSVEVANCRSDLEAREKLLAFHRDSDGRGLLLLLRASEERFGDDVLAWFAGKSVQTLDQREVLKEIYQATAIDPRISADDTLLEAMVLAGSGGPSRNAPGGVLDLDFAWSVILRQPELMNQRPDLVEILRWSLDEARWTTLRALDATLIPSFFQWVGERAGQVAKCLESLFTTDQTHLYLPLGLVAGDLFHDRLNEVGEAKDARVRIENYLNGQSIRPTEASLWSAAAREVIAKRPLEERERIAGEVDAILEGIRAMDLARYFSNSRQGFRDRWLVFAEDIDRLPNRKWETGSRAIFNSLSQLRDHGLAPLHAARLKRAEMAARLAGYEAKRESPEVRPNSLAMAAKAFAGNDSFIDWARFTLSWGDSLPEVTKVYARLSRRLTKERIEAQTAFGERLCHWHAENESGGKGFIPIESAVATCVAPLVAQCPVLLLVMDGMSFPAFHQLSGSLEGMGWVAQRKEGEEFPGHVLSVLPSVTQLSRWSLFSGSVKRDQRRTEEVAFRENTALEGIRSKGKPLLFTKKDLGSEDSVALSSKVRDVLAGTEHRVVAVVINAIDDQLKTGGQLTIDWNIHGIGILPAILEAAAEGGRAIVMTSDHGHIPEMESTRAIEVSSEGEARYRYGEPSDESERVFTGQRIEAATGGRPVILPVTESVRYGQKAGGYHGGACDLEALIPLAVFTAPGDELEGYEAIDLVRPKWWDWHTTLLDEGIALPAPKISLAKPKKKKPVTVDDLPLFPDMEADGTDTSREAFWLDALFKSVVFAEQDRLLGRAAPNKEHLRKVLATLEANRDSLQSGALALAIGQPSFRIQGMLSTIARFMNVDGYEVIEIDRDSDTVRLHRKVLATQFQISF
jgi:hypothetical protein